MIHKLKNITYDLVKMEKALVFQILEQTKKRAKHNFEKKPLVTMNGILIHYLKSDFPQIIKYDRTMATEVFLRDPDCDSPLDFNIDVQRNFESNKQRDKYYKKINQALKEWDIYVEELDYYIEKKLKQVVEGK